MPKKKVVIVGGGFAGRVARRELLRDFDVVLIDAKGYFEYFPSTLRCLVEPEQSPKIILPHPEGTKTATVASIELDSRHRPQISFWDEDGGTPGVKLTNGETERFDYCILCTGSSYAAPIKPNSLAAGSVEMRVRELTDSATRLEAAERILVVGGGTVGVELAAEIVGKWPSGKHVILVTSHSSLLERMAEKARQYAKTWLEKRGVEVIVKERVVEWKPTIRTNSGREIAADLVFSCIGGGFNSEIDKEKSHDAIPVDPATLQWRDRANVFACGDCTSTPEEKTAFAAELSAQIAVRNIRRHSRRHHLLSFPRDVCQGRHEVPQVACVSLYKDDGILQINSLVITGLPASLAKSQIEFMQLALALERPWAITVWSMMETSNLWFSRLV